MAIWAEIKKAINSDLDTPLNTKMDNLIGATGNTGGSTSAGTVMAKLNALLTTWTSTRAGYVDRLANSTYGLDKIKSDTTTNNTASKTGVLSQKLAYVISLLENTTYGLSALNTGNGAVKSVQRGAIAVDSSSKYANVTISSVNMSKTMVNIQVLGCDKNDYTGYTNDGYMCGGKLTSATNLRVMCAYGGVYVMWEVIEFK